MSIEDLFNAVQLLGERNSLEAAPFVGSWHSMVQEFDRKELPAPRLDRLYNLIYESVTREILNSLPRNLPSITHQEIDREISQTIKNALTNRSSNISIDVGRKVGNYVIKIMNEWMSKLKRSNPQAGSAFERELKNAIRNMRERPGEGEIFSQCNELMIYFLAKIVWIESLEKVEYLNPIASLIKNQGMLTIATLNYDNVIERFAQNNNIEITSGIEDWSKSGTFENKGSGLFLLKLHGSIDWAFERGRITPDQPLPNSIIFRVPPEEVKREGFKPAVIFGQKNKLTVEGPFLELLRTFKIELSQSSILTVVGYSFRDLHINEYISQWMNKSIDDKLRIIDPYQRDNAEGFAGQLIRLGRSRVEVINLQTSEGLRQLYLN